MDLREELHELRMALDMSRAEMAALFHVSVVTIWRWETKGRNIAKGVAADIMRAFVAILKRKNGKDHLQEILELHMHRSNLYVIKRILELYFEEKE